MGFLESKYHDIKVIKYCIKFAIKKKSNYL